LVLRAGRDEPLDGPLPKIIVVCGGKGGVGTTTVAINLGVSLAREGRRVVLVDVDFAGPDVANLCRVDQGYGAADVLAGRRTVHEVLQLGPGGIQVLPAIRGSTDPEDCTPAAQERLIAQLQALGPHADHILLDAGSGSGRVMRRFWEAANAVLLVTHPDTVAVMDAYAVVKLICQEQPPGAAIATVANCATDEAAAADVHERLDRACRRFLGLSIAAAGHIPFDPCVPRADAVERPLLIESPQCDAAAAIDRLARQLLRLVENHSPLHVHFNLAPSAAQADV
jgi:flagellar biosynthesis protein FlhG